MSQILYMTVSDFITDFSDCLNTFSLIRKKESNEKSYRDMPCRYIWTEQSHIALQIPSQTHSLNNL
jgi:hypothetical protein